MAETTQTPGGTPQTHTLSASGADVLTLPEGLSVSEAEFAVDGSDLVLTFPDGSKVTVENYYEQAQPPQIASADGANLSGDMVVQLTGTPDSSNASAIQQFADAASGSQVIGGTDGAPIGTVKTLTGEVWVTRADGTRVQLQAGDQVYQGDSIETGPKGAIGVLLADETTFSMGEDSSMVLDEMVYDPATQNGSLNVSVVQGVFTFVSGQVAKTDPDAMKIDTPVATIGIRGTQVGIEIPPAGEGDMQIVLMQEADGFVGEVVIENNTGQIVMNQGGDFVNIPSYDSQASLRGTMSDDDIVERHATTLKHLPVESTEGDRTSGNHFGLQEDIEQGANKEPTAEELANTETAAGQEESQQPTPEVDAQPDLPSAEDLNNLDTQAGGQQGFQEDFTDVTTEIDPFAPGTQDTGLGENTTPQNNTTTPTNTDAPANKPSETEQVFVGDGASVAAGTGSGLEDGVINLPLTVNKVDANDTLSVTLNGIPEGAVLRSGGTTITVAGGSATLTEAQISGLNITPPENYSGSFNINVSATTTEGGVVSSATTGTITVDVAGVADVPTLSMTVGDEVAGAVPLNIIATTPDTDGSETVTVTIGDIPVGSTLNLGDGTTFTATEGNTSVTLSQGQLSGLSIVPIGEDLFNLSVTATTTETNGDSLTLPAQSLTVDPFDLAEGATLVLGDVIGNEDTAIALPITIDKADVSETAEITLSGIPQGAVLTNANGPITVNEDGTVVLSEADLAGLQITPPAFSDVDFDIGVSVVTRDGDSVSDPATGTINVGVAGVANVPTLEVGSAIEGTGFRGDAIPLDISSALTDTDGSETLSVSISGVPAGATLSAGTYDAATDTWTLTPEQLDGLSVSVGDDFDTDFQITVTATSTESDGGDTATQTATIDVDVNRDVLTGGDDIFQMDDDAVVYAGEGDDVITGTAGDDVVFGEEGDDTFIGGQGGSDAFIGGIGTDTVDYSALDPASPIYVNLTDDPGQSGVAVPLFDFDGDGDIDAADAAGAAASGDYDYDLLSGIENVVGGAGDDIIVGSDGANVLAGGLGDDILAGGGGDDTIIGGEGTDTAVFEDSFEEFTVNLDSDSGELSVGGSDIDGNDTLIDVEVLQFGDLTITVEDLLNAAMPDLDVSAVDTSTVEDVAVALPISASLADGVADGTETLSVTLSGIPEGAVLSVNGVPLEVVDGAITFADGVVPEGLAILPPPNSATDMHITVSATSQSVATVDGVAQTTTSEQVLTVTLAPDAEAPVVTAAGTDALAFNEDAGAIDVGALFSAVTVEPGEEIASFTIGGLPEGVTLSGPVTDNGDGTFTIAAEDLGGVQLNLPENFDANFTLQVSATASQTDPETGAIDYETSAPIDVPLNIIAQADAPTLAVGGVSGAEDAAIPLNIQASLNDDSEVLSVTITGVPEGATLSAGTYDAENGTWTLTPDQLDGLTVTPGLNDDGDFTLNVTATSTETDPDTGAKTTATTTGAIAVTVDAVADGATLTVESVTTNEDTAIALPISIDKADESETAEITLSGIPQGAVLSNANGPITVNEDGTVVLSEADLAGLQIQPPTDSDLDFDLGVSVVTIDGDDRSEPTTGTIGVDVDGIADVPNLSVGTGPAEGAEIPLNINAAVADINASGAGNEDGAETIQSITISDIPPGARLLLNGQEVTLTAVDASGNLITDIVDTVGGVLGGGQDLPEPAAYTVTFPGGLDLSDLTIISPVGLDSEYNLTVTAVSEEDGTTASNTASVTIAPPDVADGADIDLGVAQGDEDTAIALPITVTKVDEGDTAEITLSGIPGGAKLEYVDGAGNIVEIPVTNGTVILNEEQLNGLQITPPEDSDVDMPIGVSVVTRDGDAVSDPVTGTINVGVDGVADVPSLNLTNAAGAEDSAIPLNIQAGLNDLDGSESLSVTISGVPAGATLSAGSYNTETGVWTLSAEDLNGLTITPAANDSTDFTLSVTVTATEADGGDQAVATGEIFVDVSADADAPVLTLTDAVGNEDTAIPLDITATLPDESEVLSLSISGIPDGAVLTVTNPAGNPVQVTVVDGVAKIPNGLVGGDIAITPPADSADDFQLTVTATAKDGGSIATTQGTMNVTVQGVADGAVVTDTVATGLEDTLIPITVDVAELDTDGSETLSVTLSNIPQGAVIMRNGEPVAVNEDGTVTLGEGELDGLAILPPADFSGSFDIAVSATTADEGDVSEAALGSISVDVAGQADGADLNVAATSGDEDTAIALPISIDKADDSETAEITLSGIPEGATLSNTSGPITVVDGIAVLSEADLAGLQITPPADSGADFQVGVSVVTTDGVSTSEPTTGTINVGVDGVADVPSLTIGDVSGAEDSAIPLNIQAGLGDLDGSESLSVTISGVPEGATLSAGTKNENGTWTLSGAELAGLTVTPADDDDTDFTLTVTATATDTDPDTGDTSTESVTGTMNVVVDAQADAPTLTLTDAAGAEDQPIALNIDAGLSDDSEVLSITISGVPAGAVLNHGTDNGDGTWTLNGADLDGLTITAPADSNEDFNLTVTATSTESDGSIAETSQNLSVTVQGVADGATVSDTSAAGVEDTAIPFTVDVTELDTDGSETLSVTLSNIPQGAVIMRNGEPVAVNEDGSVTLGEGELDGLAILPPADFSGNFELTVSATTTDEGDVSETALGAVSVDVSGAADGAAVADITASGDEDTGIALPISIDKADDSETAEITLSGIPQGAILSNANGPITVTDGVAVLSEADLAGLQITPPADSDVDFDLGVSVVTTDGTSISDPATGTISVGVDGVADVPTLTVDSAVSGTEDGGPIALDIASSLTDADGSESLSITISGVPADATLSAGTKNEDGTWTLSSGDLDGLSVTPGADSGEDFQLTVTATSTEGDGGDTATQTATIDVSVASQADAPTVTADAATGDEDTPIALNIDAAAAAQDINGEVTGVTISDIPAGATLTLPGGLTFTASETSNSVTLTPAQLEGLTITPPADSSDDFQLTITATAQETDPDTGDVTTATSAPATLDVTVQGVADGAQVADTTATGAEDTAIPLTIDVTELDTDGSETLSVTLSNIPEGALLTRNGEPLEIVNGSVTLAEGELDGLEITPPADFSGNFDITVSATTTDEGDVSETTTGTISVDVAGGADGATVTLGAAQGDEDTAIALPITIDKADESETAQITLSGIPDGAVLSNANGPINVTDGVAVLSEADLAGLQIEPPAGSGTDFPLNVSVVTTDGNSTSEPATGTINVGVDAVADVPSLTVGSVTGSEDSAIPLNISAGLNDTDGSEVLSVTISEVPPGAVLTLADGSSFTATPENTTFLFAGDQLEGLTITPPENSDADFSLNVVATSLDTDPDTGAVTTSSVEGSMTVSVDPDADAPTLELADAAGTEDQPIALDIGASLTDASETLSVTISGVPQGATLSAGSYDAETDTWTLDSADLNGLTVKPAPNSNEDFSLTVTAVSTESDGSTASTTSTLNVAVTGDADAPTLNVTLGEGVPTTIGGSGGSGGAGGSGGSGGSGGYVGDGSDLQNQFVDSNAQNHTAGGGDDVWVVDRDLRMNENFTMGGGNDTLIINGDVPGGTNLNMGGGNDSITINGDITGNASVQGAGQTNGGGDVLYLGKTSDHYQLQNFTISPQGMINTQIIDLDTGQVLTVNNIEAIGFGDGTHVGNEDLLQFQTPGGVDVVEYPLDINAALTDIDGSETLSATISGVPEGATLTLADGTVLTSTGADQAFELSADQLQGITLTVSPDATDFNLSVTATATENDGDTASVSTIVGVDVPDPVADAPELDVSDASGAEDSAIPLTIDAALTDADESLSVTISGIPDGAVLKSGDTTLVVENGEITFADGVVPDNLTIQPPTNSDVDMELTVTATSTEFDGSTASTTSTLNVAVSGVADAPTLTVDLGAGEPVGGSEAVPGSVTITNAAQGEAGYHNTYGYYVMGEDGTPQSGQIVWADVKDTVGDTFTLDGVDPEDIGFFVIPNGDGLNNNLSDGMSVTFTQGQDGNWHVVGPTGQVLSGQGDPVLFSDPALNEGNFDYTQDTSRPGNQNWEDLAGGGDNDFNDININVETVATQPGTGGPEFVEYPLNVNALLTDTDGSETLSATLSGMPAGAVVTLADGTEFTISSPTSGVELTSTQLQGITLTVPVGSEDFDLQVTATATEADGDTATVSTSVGVDVPVFDDEASDPSLSVSDASGVEDIPIPLDITASLTDLDGSEEISSITLSGIPAGATLNNGEYDAETNTWSLELSDLVDLEVTPAANSNEDFQITVSVTSTESNGGATATTTATIDVDVTGVVDDFTVATQDAAGEAGTELPLSIDVGLTDLDGSETVSVTLTGIPEGATLNHGTFDEGTGNWTLSGGDLDGLTISLPETVEGEGGGEPATLYSQNFNDTFDGQTAAWGDNGFSSTGGSWGNDDRTAADNDRFEFQNPSGGDISTFTTAAIDISGQEDVSFSFNLKGYGDLDSSGSYADYFKVIAVVDGVEHELMTENGDVEDWTTFTLDNIPQGDELIIKMEVRTTGDDEKYKMDNLKVEGTPATAEPLESFQIGVETTVTESDGASETHSTTLNVDINNDAEADAPTLTVTEQAPTTEDVAVALNIAAALTDTDGSETLSVTLSGIPDGAVLKSGDTVLTVENGEITFADGVVPDNLSLTPPANSDADIELTVSATSTEANGGATTTTTSTIDIDVSALADVPTITSVTIGAPVITEGTEGEAETVTISSANFGESDAGFSIAARTINSNGTLSEASTDNVSTNGSPLGFGVAGSASGADSELGYDNQHGVSEELIVTFDDDVSSADVAFAWMHSGEQAGYKLFRDGVEVGSGTVNGVTDNIDDPVTLSTTDGGTFDQIVFTAPGSGDDYLINSISFETPSGTPDVAEYPIDIVASLADTDGSENLSITIGGVPAGASLSAGSDNGDGTWTVSGGDLEGLSLTVPFEDEVEAFDLTFTATATEQSNNSMATSAAVVVAAAAVVAPEPEPAPEPVEEDFDGEDHDGEDNNNDEMVGGDTSKDDWTGNYQAQTYAGSTKNDDLNTGGGGDTLYGGAGNDELTGSWGNDTFFGGSGNDELEGGDGNDLLFGGSGNDEIEGGTGNDEIQGGSGNDEIEGDDGNDLLYGGAGNDEIEGGTGHDTVYGGSGNDEIEGNDGNDLLYGGSGNDEIEGGSGHDTVYGGAGNDEIEGNDGNDLLYGGSGDDEIEGGSGHDTVHGGSGDDEIEGNDGNDLLYGGSGNDEIEGGDGHDQLFGGLGNDFLEGGSGNDTLFGGAGNDVLNGGSGNDTFIFDADSGHDIIEDIMLQDTLEFQGEQFDMNDMIFSENEDGDAVISFAGKDDQSVTLEGVKFSDLDRNGDGDASEGYSVTQTDDGFSVNIDDT
ncbi:MAG: FecR domain-containing protein [Rhodospirillales bacterium]